MFQWPVITVDYCMWNSIIIFMLACAFPRAN